MEVENLICMKCQHYCLNNSDNLICGCRAFPDGIPSSVIEKNVHDNIIEGQKGDFLFKKV